MLSLSSETGGVCIAPLPAEPGAEIRPAMAMRPFFGIQPALLGEKVIYTCLFVSWLTAWSLVFKEHGVHL